MTTNVPLPSTPDVDVHERRAWTMPAPVGLLGIVAAAGLIALGVQQSIIENLPLGPILIGIGALALAVLASGLCMLSPGDAKVLEFFGSYIGTIRKPGLWFVKPFSVKKKISVKVRNFETHELKVNDADGNPINIAAIVVWQVADTAQAKYAVEDHIDFVRVQSEAALRHIAMSHPYDNQDTEITLRGDTEVIAQEMANEVAERIALAGLRVVETRISSLAYASEIAQAMLQRQQAAAIIAAREKIVEGAVTMVQDALNQLEAADVVVLDDERRAAMVSNLLVVLCGDSRATPIVNAGSLYQ
ncbi:SPFH domain-containing protein [Arachnia rubra]|jgi:membrane protease subunits, stomatin/prohibitin homologs (membrane protease subunit, stomatin/prohibitin homolog)|uniref:SPFH domain-containing protein n=1 Tax=Arachnia rubra TaxID=1547448 RepID=A0ABX7Y5R5_9ACTN|nr:SPFH domain-containing protein [Arachnia rubra]MBB1578011.1 SPFH domain-containing protein [Propionibacterium sp.]MDO4646543.1 SPFH domain-containing protein [Propionibacteriaceae bacterium]QUC08417.1 SPFH domain-containing protein [Arachnia rubra]BCR79797.1 membrane protease subunit [Arachnia rubra]